MRNVGGGRNERGPSRHFQINLDDTLRLNINLSIYSGDILSMHAS
jgi:hypothetical protein